MRVLKACGKRGITARSIQPRCSVRGEYFHRNDLGLPNILPNIYIIKMTTKNYLRYVHESTFGLVAASQVGSSIEYLRMRNTKDRYVAVPANEDVFFWDLKTKQLVNQLTYDGPNFAEVTILKCFNGGHPRTNLIAVGYANGHIRIFEYETGELKTSFIGHRTAISALCFDKDGSRLASGSKDCNIVLWDVVGERGLFSLKGHKNSISKLAFLYNEDYQRDILISSSIDAVSTIKFWNLQLQHCFCTLPGQASGVWSFVLLRNGTRLVAGTTGPELKVYSIKFLNDDEIKFLSSNVSEDIAKDVPVEENSEYEYGLQVRHIGNILRNSSAVSSRVQDIIVDEDESLMVCHSLDKNVEMYGLRSNEDALTYAKKQAKKAVRKMAKRKRQENPDADDAEPEDITKSGVTSLDELAPGKLLECEFNRKLGCRKISDKVRALSVTPTISKNGSRLYKFVTMTATNRISNFILDPKEELDESIKEVAAIESVSHRSDVRCVDISADNTLILSASAESLKIWRLDSKSCISTVETDYVTCCVFSNAKQLLTISSQNRYVLLGTKTGSIQIVDTTEGCIIDTIQVCDDNKPLSSICVLPERTGIVCGGEGGVARFYEYVFKSDEDELSRTILTLKETRSLPFREGITCIKISANSNLLAVGLLDNTVRVHFMDTFKYFLTMYGHKFPVTTMDISDDNTLLATGSPDKNIKIWGLDFGDCHKSIFAHDDSITCVRFVPKTHYIFSCARDRDIKQWDCDHFIKIQTLKRHMAEIWCLAISPNGKYIVTGSHDKSIRFYRKSEEILVPSEEEEAERELEDEKNVYEKQENIILGETNTETGFAAKMTIDTVRSTDRLIEAIDVYEEEQAMELEYQQQSKSAESKGEAIPKRTEHNPLLITVGTDDYERFMLEILRRIRSSELEEILLTLPFDYVRKLLVILLSFLEKSWDTELVVRCAIFLLKVNYGQIAASPAISITVYKIGGHIMKQCTKLRDCAGFNLMALEHLKLNRKYQSTKVSY